MLLWELKMPCAQSHQCNSIYLPWCLVYGRGQWTVVHRPNCLSVIYGCFCTMTESSNCDGGCVAGKAENFYHLALTVKVWQPLICTGEWSLIIYKDWNTQCFVLWVLHISPCLQRIPCPAFCTTNTIRLCKIPYPECVSYSGIRHHKIHMGRGSRYCRVPSSPLCVCIWGVY